MMVDEDCSIRVSLVGLYSSRYPALGETHALSVLAGVAKRAGRVGAENCVAVLDMVSLTVEEVEPILEFVRATRPHLLGISVAYGTFSFLLESLREITETAGRDCWIVVGGPIATGVPELILQHSPNVIVALGEGENSFLNLIQARRRGRQVDLHSVPGVAYVEGGQVQYKSRVLSDLGSVAVPERQHIGGVVDSGGQVFAEVSRGCSWSACHFCLRGLTDLRGIGTEYRQFCPERLKLDLEQLKNLGVGQVTIADEDFLGTNIEHARCACETVARAMAGVGEPISFDVSLMPHSVFTDRMSRDEVEARSVLLQRLVDLGLHKAFLGIESGAPSQLRRYAKGHSRDEAAAAVKKLQELGVGVEIGWIMFDPLCTFDEINENCDFLEKLDLVHCVSNLFSELRLQKGTRYLALLESEEKKMGVNLINSKLDPDTLSYLYSYACPEVERVVSDIRKWSSWLRPLHYPLKSITRFDNVVLGESSELARSALDYLRRSVFDAFKIYLESFRESRPLASKEDAIRTVELAAGIVAATMSDILAEIVRNRSGPPLLRNLYSVASSWESRMPR